MSKLGNIYNSYGKGFGVAIANTYSYNIENASNLPKSSLIISAPFDKNTYEDIDSHSLFATDYEGNPVRLSYSVSYENGLKYKDDMIQVSIDNITIKEKNKKFSLDVNNLIDDNVLNGNNQITLNSQELTIASDTKYGVGKYDNYTTKENPDGSVFVDTESLDLATNQIYGIGIGDGNSISSNNGILYVNTNNLKKSSSNNLGIIKTDGTSIVSNNGTLSVNKNDLLKDDDFSLVKGDNSTVNIENGTISINIDKLQKASYNKLGTISFNSSQFFVDSNETIHVLDYDETNSNILDIISRINSANSQLDSIIIS